MHVQHIITAWHVDIVRYIVTLLKSAKARNEIVGMRGTGQSLRHIVARLYVAHNMVNRLEYIAMVKVEKERPSSISDGAAKSIPVCESVAAAVSTVNVSVSRNLVNKRLIASALRAHRPLKMARLAAIHRHNRRFWAQEWPKYNI